VVDGLGKEVGRGEVTAGARRLASVRPQAERVEAARPAEVVQRLEVGPQKVPGTTEQRPCTAPRRTYDDFFFFGAGDKQKCTGTRTCVSEGVVRCVSLFAWCTNNGQ